MKEGKGKVLIIVLVIMVVVLVGLNIYQFFYGKDNVTGDNDNYLTLVDGHRVRVESNDAKVLRTIGTNEKYVFYKDNGLNLYEIETRKISKINLDVENFDNLYIYQMPNGFIYSDYKNNINGFYNFKNNTIMLKNKYDSLFPVYDEYRKETDYLIAYNKDGRYVINSLNNKIIVTSKVSHPNSSNCEDECYTRGFRVEQSGWFREYIVAYWYSEGTGGGYNEYGYTIYDTEGKKVAELEDDEYYDIKNWDSLIIYKKEKSIHLF